VYGCEALQEVDEIVKVLGADPGLTNRSINLLGHGSFILASDADYLKGITFIPRVFRNRTRINAVIVGGEFNESGGKPSELISRLHAGFGEKVDVRNGGSYEKLKRVLEALGGYEVIMWFPVTDVEHPEFTAEVKRRYPHKTLIAGMFNPSGEVPFSDMLNRALGVHANLFVEFHGSDCGSMRLFDALANQYAETTDPLELAAAIMRRLDTLVKFTRQGSMSVGDAITMPESAEIDRYIEIVRGYGEQFHSLIHPSAGVQRYLGNTSVCIRSLFPHGRENIMFISRRDIDKRNIGREGSSP
jgi:hypothetical protein